MKPARAPVPDPRRAAAAERRKRLGQYFTGTGLGRLLAALAQAEKARTIVDPMAGSGDLLASCLEIGAKPDALAGIEIDAAASDALEARLSSAQCVRGSAFDAECVGRLPAREWDLVIANPPYVRYQSFSDKADASLALPSAMQIRTGLLQSLPLLTALDTEDRRLFAHLVSGYSGLSDLAVPSWILCAGLVRMGGRLALVVPESWLSRDYATIVHYLLFRWFDVEFVVEDEHASWFEDAQVKATLIVAKRVKRRASALARPEGATYCHITVSAAAASAESPIGRIALAGSQDVEKSFAKQARLWLRNASDHGSEFVSARPVSIKHACRNVIANASRQKWLGLLGEAEVGAVKGFYVPHEIHDWLARRGLAPTFETFEAQGVAVGQGLRTGANDFFYANGQRHRDVVDLSFFGPLAGLSAKAPLSIAKPVLRRQSELPDGYVVSSSTTNGWALDLRSYALPEDMEPGDLVSTPRETMPPELAEVVRAAAQANFGTPEKPLRVYELTAVATNVRPASRGARARRWYMLPDFASRHLPDVVLARVNSATPRAYLNERRECLVDANFSTLWTLPNSRWNAEALLALINSSWAQAVIEQSGAVMGGGALKMEATHLRRFPVPALDGDQLAELAALGARLALGDGVEAALDSTDALLARALGCDAEGTCELKKITRDGQSRRAKHNGKRGEDHGDEVC